MRKPTPRVHSLYTMIVARIRSQYNQLTPSECNTFKQMMNQHIDSLSVPVKTKPKKTVINDSIKNDTVALWVSNHIVSVLFQQVKQSRTSKKVYKVLSDIPHEQCVLAQDLTTNDTIRLQYSNIKFVCFEHRFVDIYKLASGAINTK